MDHIQFEKELADLACKLDPDEYDGDFEEHAKVAEDMYFDLLKRGLSLGFKEALHHHGQVLAQQLENLSEDSDEYRATKREAEEYLKKATLKGCSGAASNLFLRDLGTRSEQLAYGSLSLDYDFDYIEDTLRGEGMDDSEVEQAKALRVELQEHLKANGVETILCQLVFQAA